MRAGFRALPKWARVTLWTVAGLFVALLIVGAVAPAQKTGGPVKPAAVTTPKPPVVDRRRKHHHRPAPAPVATTPTAAPAPAATTPTQTQTQAPPQAPPPSPTEDVGSSSHAGDAQFCSAHQCIGDFTGEGGTIVRCADNTYSHAGGISGSCSHHGGEG